MTDAALNHLLRTLAAVPTERRVLLRNPTDEARVARLLAQMGFEVHAAAGTDEGARSVQEATEQARRASKATDDAGGKEALAEEARSPSFPPEEAQTAPLYATAAPLGALPYPEAHFGWAVVNGPAHRRRGGPAAPEPSPAERGRALLEEARHHLRPGGWVVFACGPEAHGADDEHEGPPLTPEALAGAAERAGLAEAEAPERTDDGALQAIFRRVEAETPP
jgi:SAM-dependent methyltransferase